MTTVTIENEHGIYTVSLKRDEVNLSDFIGELVDPALRAAGYSFENIEVE